MEVVRLESPSIPKVDGDKLSFFDEKACDLSQFEKIEEQLRLTNARLLDQSFQLRELQQFSEILAHDLSTPLRMIKSYLNLIQKKCGPQFDEETTDLFSFAIEGSKRMKELIDGLLEYSCLDTDHKQIKPVAARAAVEKAVGALGYEIEQSGAKIKIGILPRVYWDERLLISVFQNLIGNAVKYRREICPEVEISCEEDETNYTFLVTDNGMGLCPEECMRVFYLFQRGADSVGLSGAGLGLALCRKIITGHGGKIWIHSEVGKGTTVYFSLPKTP
jgi:two-component system, chemotaxis family, sensor kinase Cph1